MCHRWFGSITATALLLALATPASGAGQAPAAYQPPRTPDGQPDIQGVWEHTRSFAGTIECEYDVNGQTGAHENFLDFNWNGPSVGVHPFRKGLGKLHYFPTRFFPVLAEHFLNDGDFNIREFIASWIFVQSDVVLFVGLRNVAVPKVSLARGTPLAPSEKSRSSPITNFNFEI